jgi:pyruvate/2-oxoglutarate dehydrogenase complex dihydrolipoamide dehydrogenase (E3) component
VLVLVDGVLFADDGEPDVMGSRMAEDRSSHEERIVTPLETFDAVVVGTGQGGKPLAADLATAGWRTAIVEKGRVGGTCVVCGCTPTKTMIASARVAHIARRAADYGIEAGPVSVDLETVRRRKRQIVDEWTAGSRKGLERHENLELIMGKAGFVAPHEVEVTLREGGSRRLAADHIFLNVGGRPAVPSIPGLDGIPYLTSTSVMELGAVPEHLIVLGGGFVGLEFGQMFRRFGAAVTIVERGPRLVGREDEDISEAIREVFEEEGIRVLTESEAVSVGRTENSGLRLRVRAEGQETDLHGSHLLVAAGRASNADILNLEATGLATNERGWIPVNERCETEVEGIWALGDVTGAPPFTHIAYDDYRVIRANLLEGGARTTTDRLLPYAVFIDPQLGRVGLTEREALERGYNVRVAKLPMTRVARAIEVDETRGFMKAVVDAETDRILGAAVLGIEGGEVVSVLQMAMVGELPYQVLRDAVIAHPTLAESINNLFMTLGD